MKLSCSQVRAIRGEGMKKAIRHAKLYMLVVIAALLAVASVPATAQHDMSNMPGMSGKPKPKPKPTSARRKQSTQAKPKEDKAKEMEGTQMPEPAAQPGPSPAPEPKASPQPTEMNMPGMKMPAISATPSPAPSPQASPEKMEMSMPMPQPSPSPNANQAQPAKSNDSMPGMEMNGMRHPSSGTGRISADDPRALMIMSGEMMDIRVGSKARNSISMGQMGSGTSWQPTTTPMYMWSKVSDKWLVFIHGDAKIGVNAQGGPRGVTKFESQNWIMPMAFRRLGPGTVNLRGMFSLEPLTFSPGGSPQLFQTGETYKGEPLIDRQHPHDLFMELSATYTMPIGERGTWFVYGGFPGEPALGPVAFMHRASASENV